MMDKQLGEDSGEDSGKDDEGYINPGSGADDSFDDGWIGAGDHRPPVSSSSNTATSGAPKSIDTPQNTSKIAISTTKSHSSVTRPVAPWKRRSYAFGLFFAFDDKKFTAPKSLADALAALDDADRRWASDARELDLLANLYLSPHDIDSEPLAAAQGTITSLFTEYILCRRATWARATSLSQSLFQVAARILATFCEAFRIYIVVQRHIGFAEMRAEHNAACAHEVNCLNTRIERSSTSLVVAHWTYLELQAFEKMATEYLNRQEGDWLSVLPTDLAQLRRIAQAQVEWADAFSKLKVEQLAQRKALWSTVTTSTPFRSEHLTSGMRYTFGNPVAGEEPAGLQDALTRAAEELARPASSMALTSDATDMEGVTNHPGTTNEDVIMTDTSSSAPGSEQDPTIPAPETAPVPLPQRLLPWLPLRARTIGSTLESCTPPVQSPPAVAPPSSATPPLSIASPSSVAPASSVVSAPPDTSPASTIPDTPADPILSGSPTAPPISSPAELTTEKPSARKQLAPKSNEHDASTKRTSVRQAAIQAVAQVITQDNDAPARATRAGTKQAEKEKEKEKQAAAGKRAPRKSKGRR